MRVLQWAMHSALLFPVLRASLSALQRTGWPLVVSLGALSRSMSASPSG